MARTVTVNCPRCEGEVEMNVWSEMYGADADGNRGVWRDEADVEMPCKAECELTHAEYERMVGAAIEKKYADEDDYYAEPEEATTPVDEAWIHFNEDGV